MKRHLFRHPWTLKVRLRSAFDDLEQELGVGDTLVYSAGEPLMRVRYEGKTLKIDLLRPFLDFQPHQFRKIADFAEVDAK